MRSSHAALTNRRQGSKKVVDKSKIVEASDAGRAAVDALAQINEYFDQSDTSLQVISPGRVHHAPSKNRALGQREACKWRRRILYPTCVPPR